MPIQVPATHAFNVTSIVGITLADAPKASNLVSAVMRTVVPTNWFGMGGHGNIQAVFNPSGPGGKFWFLAVYTEVPGVFESLLQLLAELGNPLAPPGP
jgi:hypothetical protein